MKRQGDTFMRLVNRDGNLIMDEGDIEMDRPLKAPLYIRKKRIAHARDFQKFLDVSRFNGSEKSNTTKQMKNILATRQV